MKIITDHKWKNFLFGYELPATVKTDFDYIDADEIESHDFIKYRGVFYDPSDIMRIEETSPLALFGYHGCHGDSYFSGILIKISDDGEQYQIATYIS